MSKILAFLRSPIAALLNLVHLNTPARIVVFLSPFFVSAAGLLATLVARYIPGHPHLSAGEVTSVFVTGSILAATKLLVWLHGAQKAEGAASAEKVAKIACTRHLGPHAPLGRPHVLGMGLVGPAGPAGPAGVAGPVGPVGPTLHHPSAEEAAIVDDKFGAPAEPEAVPAEPAAEPQPDVPHFHDVGTV